jgi:predicted DNA-binding transcriptional regulator AlpA
VGLPSKLLRFRDLQKIGIVTNWPQLKQLVQKQGFPPGRLLGVNSRAWPQEEVEAWWCSRPVRLEDPPPENVKPAPLRQEGSRRVVKEDRQQSSTASDSAAQATSREDEE